MKKIIGIDIGGTKCAVALGEYRKNGIEFKKGTDSAMTIIDKNIIQTEVQKGPEYTLSMICDCINKLLHSHNLAINDIHSIGISCGGPLDSKAGIILSPPNLIGWDYIPIIEIFEGRFGIKTKIQNDANACALAEWKFGTATEYNNIIFLTFGTGMGAGLILDGRLYSGTNDMAGEIGHIRLADYGPVGYGKAGSFEGFCSGGGIARLARIKVMEKLQMGQKVSFCSSVDQLGKLNAKLVGDAAEAGDELAREIYRISGSFLGKGLAILIDILNPEMIVIGSIFARSESLLREAALEIINRECISHSRNVCKIVPARLGEKLGDYAALAVALYEPDAKE